MTLANNPASSPETTANPPATPEQVADAHQHAVRGNEVQNAGNNEADQAATEADRSLNTQLEQAESNTGTQDTNGEKPQTAAQKEAAEKQLFSELKNQMKQATDPEEIAALVEKGTTEISDPVMKQKLTGLQTKYTEKLSNKSWKDKLSDMIPGAAKFAPFLAMFGMGPDSWIMKIFNLVSDFSFSNKVDAMIDTIKQSWSGLKKSFDFDLDFDSDDFKKSIQPLYKYISKIDGIDEDNKETWDYILGGETSNQTLKSKLGNIHANIAHAKQQPDMNEDEFLKILEKPKKLAKAPLEDTQRVS